MIRIDKDAEELLPELIEHCAEVKRMDDEHGELYLFGETTTQQWVSPWQASELQLIRRMGELLPLTSRDVVMDLGCGDGRVNLALTRLFGCRGYGWDSSSLCIDTAKLLQGSNSMCSFHVVNFLNPEEWLLDQLSQCTVLFTYLPVQGLLALRPLLEHAFKSAAGKANNLRLVTNHYHLPEEDGCWQVLVEEGELRVSRLVKRV